MNDQTISEVVSMMALLKDWLNWVVVFILLAVIALAVRALAFSVFAFVASLSVLFD